MIEPHSINESLLYGTLAIRTDTGSGSGFIYTHTIINSDDFPVIDGTPIMLGIPLLITNKHVVHGATRLQLIFHGSEQGKPNGMQHIIDSQGFQWVDHPGADIDLCAIPLKAYLTELEERGVQPYFKTLTEAQFPTQDELQRLAALEDVVMVGYPNGLSDVVNNFPLLRQGSTASHPAIDFNGKPQGMVDIACFPGSSGSTIFILHEHEYRDKYGYTYMGASRFYLLGVLTSGPFMRRDGTIEVREIPTRQVPVPVTEVMIHLGYYVKAREVKELVRHLVNLDRN